MKQYVCKYKNICTFYKKPCIEMSCWRSKYLNGMLDSKIVDLIKSGRLEIILNPLDEIVKDWEKSRK